VSIRPDPVKISMEDAQSALTKAIIERGEDFVYAKRGDIEGVVGPLIGCVYFDAAGSPDCLVGHVLATVGVAPMPYSSTNNQCNIPTLVEPRGHRLRGLGLREGLLQDHGSARPGPRAAGRPGSLGRGCR